MIHIYGTLGPSCSSAEILAEMLRDGMTGVRLNLSHETLPEAAPILSQLRLAAERTGVYPELLIDLQGPELRVGILPEPLSLPEGESVSLDSLALPEAVRSRLLPEQQLLLDDGTILLSVESDTHAKVIRGGILHSRKSIAVPGMEIYLPALTEADLKNLRLAPEYGVTGVMQPFVRSREDLLELRRALNSVGGEKIRIFAKIENRRGMAELPNLLPEADEIVIARGDLGNDIPLYQLPEAQKRIAESCRDAGKPFMVVTQMLASMEHHPMPTRAEVSDIFNAVLDGASSVMITGETAVGAYPAEAVWWLARTAESAERCRNNPTDFASESTGTLK